jgi:hypothetical protein
MIAQKSEVNLLTLLSYAAESRKSVGIAIIIFAVEVMQRRTLSDTEMGIILLVEEEYIPNSMFPIDTT